MGVALLTGADLRDWHAEHATPGQHAVLVDMLDSEEAVSSWEAVAASLRRGLGDADLRFSMDRHPIVFGMVLVAYVRGFGDGAGATHALWQERIEAGLAEAADLIADETTNDDTPESWWD